MALEGATVIVADRDSIKGEATATDICEAGGSAAAIAMISRSDRQHL
jgi:hypothetical protein